MMVRAAVAEDADEVRRLSEQFTPSSRRERSLELFTDEYARIIDDNRYLLAVADSPSGRLAGYLLAQDYGPGLRHSFTVGRIRDLFVDGKFRRRGIGRDLVAAAATWAAERPLPMILDWQAGPGSTDFYRALGYEPDYQGDLGQYPQFTLDLRDR